MYDHFTSFVQGKCYDTPNVMAKHFWWQICSKIPEVLHISPFECTSFTKKCIFLLFFYVSKFAANFLKYYIFDQFHHLNKRRSRKKCIFVIFVCFQNLPTFSNTVKLYEQRIHVSKMKKLSSGAKVTVFYLLSTDRRLRKDIYTPYILIRAAPEEILELMACNCPRKWTGEKDCCVQNGIKIR